MSEDVNAIKEKIAAIKLSSERLQSEAHDHEDLLRSGEDDYRHVLRISDCYKQLAKNSYEEGRLAAKLDFLQERSENRSHDTRDNQTEDRWDSRQERSKEDQENWWRPSQADERPELSPDDDRDDGRYRR